MICLSFIDTPLQAQSWQTVSTGGGTFDGGYNIGSDSDGNVYMTGYIDDEAHFGNHTVSSIGYVDIFVAKIDEQGNWVWANSGGGADYDYGRGVTIDNTGNVFASGDFQFEATFDDINVVSYAYTDVFIAKIYDETVVIGDMEQLSGSLSTYPNPFSTVSNIKFYLETPQTVIIRFYDQFGKQIEVMEDACQKGWNKILWAPEYLSCGIYYFLLETGDQSITGKLVHID